jgi:AbrB family looped-hinge helix DNA binding protein
MSKDTSRREVLGVSPMSHKFQVTIPKKVRDKAKLKYNDSIAFIEESGRIYIMKSTEV